jgi:hypothetical protein
MIKILSKYEDGFPKELYLIDKDSNNYMARRDVIVENRYETS